MRTTAFLPVLILCAALGGCKKPPPTAEETGVFIEAAFRGDTLTVTEALKRGMPPDQKDAEGFTALMMASHNNHHKTVQALIDAGADINLPVAGGNSALMAAAFNNHINSMQALIDAGADIHQRNDKGETPLIQACGPNQAAVRLLLENGAEVNATESTENFTALMYAATQGLSPIVDILLEFGANPSMKDVDDDTAATFARKSGFPALADKLQTLIDQQEAK